LEPVSDWPSAMAIVWKAFSFMPGNWAMISPLLTVTTPLASVLAALAAPAPPRAMAVATRPPRMNFFMVVWVSFVSIDVDVDCSLQRTVETLWGVYHDAIPDLFSISRRFPLACTPCPGRMETPSRS
jgi:hypothetical protein